MIDEKKLIEEIKYLLFNSEILSPRWFAINEVFEIIKRQPKVGKWIPCNKKLPGPYDTVIITAKMPNDKESLVYMGSINAIREWHILGIANPNDYNVTAWQPLPEPWRGEEK